MSVPSHGIYRIKRAATLSVGVSLAAAVLARAALAVVALRSGNEAPLLAMPLAVIFPALVVVALAALPSTVSREGALMRLGTMIQGVAIVALPGLALHLVLGLPVVFLAVELFETRCPRPLRDAIARRLIA